MNPTEPNTPDRIRRVRRRNAEWHVTRTGAPMLTVPCANDGPYTSRVSHGFNDDGALVARPVKP